MNIKGTTTIQLFNAETGEKEQEYKKSNIVTNAMSNLVNPSAVLKSGSNNSYAHSIRTALIKAYNGVLGGVLLFNDHHGENADKVMPDASNKLIGFAGTETTIKEDSRQGVRNTEESQEIENGYRLVWDFPTNKANGVIKSVSLTSVLAGNTGGGLLASGLISEPDFVNAVTNQFYLYYPYSSTPVSETMSDLGGVIFYIKPLEDGKLEMLYFDTSDICIYKLTYENPQIIKPLRGSPPYLLKKEKVSEPVHEGSMYRYSIWVDQQKKINITYFTGSGNQTSGIHKIYSLSGELETEKTVILPKVQTNSNYTAGYGTIGFANGKYYCMNIYSKENISYYQVYSFSETGEVIAYSQHNVPFPYNDYNYPEFFMNQYTGEMYIRMYSAYVSDFLLKIVDTDEQVELSRAAPIGDGYKSTSPYIDGDIGIKPPYIPICFGKRSNEKNVRLFFIISPYYLATINDLDTAITKTSAQTMKIIYELTEAT